MKKESIKKEKKVAQKTTKKSLKQKEALLEEMTIENKVDYTLVILEEMKDNFKAFGQELVSLHSKTDAVIEEVGMIKVELSEINFRLTGVENRLGGVESRLEVLEKEVRVIKTDVADIKKTLTTKADMKYISLFEVRVARLEKKFC